MKQRSSFAWVRGRFIAGALLVFVVTGSSAAEPRAGDSAPDFAGRTYEGHAVSLSEYSGRVQVVAVNIESGEVFRKIARKMTSLHMLVASDAAAQAQGAYGVKGIPHTVIIGKTGQIIRIHRGYSAAGVDDVVNDLNLALTQ
jgi:peroxiredoxin